jgi:hypothetical protein
MIATQALNFPKAPSLSFGKHVALLIQRNGQRLFVPVNRG